MPSFDVDQIRTLMNLRTNIRNISVIAHVDHGKSTLTDSLVCKAGIISRERAGDMRFTDTREDEQERCITIKSTGVSLYYKMTGAEFEEKEVEQVKGKVEEEEEKKDKKEESAEPAKPKYTIKSNDFLINLIDSPGHVDFSSEVTAALRVTDGALVVVDCVEGVCVQTETVLRQSIGERVRPVVWVNKIDRVMLELQLDLEEAYHSFSHSIESANVIIDTYKDAKMPPQMVDPAVGTVGFGSGLHCWGFNLPQFARIYAAKYGVTVEKMTERLWGDHFFFPETKKWKNKQVDDDGSKGIRGFVHYILKPIQTLFDAVLNDKKDKYEAMIQKLDIKLPAEAKEQKGKPLLKIIMANWLPSADALLDMIVRHLPSPLVAQKYRVEVLYNGDLNDETAKAVAACDPNGPLMMYVSKMVPTTDKGRFYAFGRVFSGVIRTNQTVNIMGPDYEQGKKIDYFQAKKIQRTVLMMGRYVEQISDCPAGNTIGLVGADQFLLKSGTITTSDETAPFKTMKFSVSPVVRVAVDVKNSQDLPKLVEGMRRLSKSDPLVLCQTTKTGEHIIAGAGELHLEICLKDLAEDFMKGAPIKVSEPVVSFCETVAEKSEMVCISKSSNKHNRLYCTAEPLGEEFCGKIESGYIELNPKDPKNRNKILVDEYKWEKNDTLKIWSFGCPPDGKCNVFVDMTKGASFLNEVKDHIIGGFMQMTSGGVFADEPLRGMRVNLMDIVLHTDAIHRGAGQITPTTKKVIAACQIKSGPRLMEPMYLVDITVPQDKVSGCYSTLQTRRGRIVPEADEATGPLLHVKAYLPVLESFGFTQKLRQNTSGKAFPQMIFDHWEQVEANAKDPSPYNSESMTHKIIMDVRKRKGLKIELPEFNDYYDKI